MKRCDSYSTYPSSYLRARPGRKQAGLTLEQCLLGWTKEFRFNRFNKYLQCIQRCAANPGEVRRWSHALSRRAGYAVLLGRCSIPHSGIGDSETEHKSRGQTKEAAKKSSWRRRVARLLKPRRANPR